MERLFGRSKAKKSSTTNPDSSPSNAAVTNEDEGFAIVSNNQAMVPPPSSNFYPVLKPELPNGTRGDAVPSAASRQTSVGASALDGIPFTLSSKCCGGNDLDEVLARVESIAERIRNVDWSTTEYDFRLEKSVINQDISHSFSTMHTN